MKRLIMNINAITTHSVPVQSVNNYDYLFHKKTFNTGFISECLVFMFYLVDFHAYLVLLEECLYFAFKFVAMYFFLSFADMNC